jgi:hypothetical protein
MIINYKDGKLLIVALLILGSFLLRPSIFGQSYSLLGGGILLATLAMAILMRNTKFEKSDALWIGLMGILFWLYCLVLSLFSGNSNLEFVYKASAAGIVSFLTYSYMFTDVNLRRLCFDIFSKINALLGYSIFISFILLFFLGVDSITLGKIDIHGYDEVNIQEMAYRFSTGGVWVENGQVVFPFSIIYGYLSDYNIYRFLGVYRESGIAQMFFLWSAWYLYFRNINWKWLLGSILGAIFVMSTAFFLTALASLVTFISLDKRFRFRHRITGLLIVTFVLVLFFMAPGIGLVDKMLTHSESLNDRIEPIISAFDDHTSTFFGEGLYLANENSLLQGINALAYIYYYGIIGFILYLCIFMIAFVQTDDKTRCVTLTSIILTTSLIFQPIIDAPLVNFLIYGLLVNASEGRSLNSVA